MNNRQVIPAFLEVAGGSEGEFNLVRRVCASSYRSDTMATHDQPMTTPTQASSSIASTTDIRACFPALERVHNNFPVAYFDGPGGTQVPRQSRRGDG